MTYKVWVCLECEYDDIEADSEDEAMGKAADGDTVYEEEEPIEAVEVDEFFIDW